MIAINITRTGLTVDGHAGYAEIGNDIICAAVSALTQGLQMMSEIKQKLVKNAVCAQIEYLDANGGAEMDMGNGMSGATLGKFSYSGASSGNGSTEQSIFSPRAERILWPTGLTYRGGSC